MSVYSYKVLDNKKNEVNLDAYKGKVLLIVNTATECGFTPQYEDLQNLYEKYKESGLEILDFPCDQFGHQAPGSDEEIASFCTSRFGITFPLFAKVEVNGDNAIDLFKFLKSEKGFGGFDPAEDKAEFLGNYIRAIDPNFESNAEIKWNFTKFLVDRNGTPVKRFEPIDNIAKVEEAIKELL